MISNKIKNNENNNRKFTVSLIAIKKFKINIKLPTKNKDING